MKEGWQSAWTAACLWLVTASVLIVAGLAVGDAEAQDQAKDATARGNAHFDDFDRDELGDQYSVIDSDPNRLTLSGGKLVIVGTHPGNNFVLLNKSFPGDFVATVKFAMEVGQANAAGLRYQVDQQNYLVVGIEGGLENRQVFSRKIAVGLPNRRQPFFVKITGGEPNLIAPPISVLGDRSLKGYSSDVENWYIQLRREGFRYTGLISADGVRWTPIGTHAVLQHHGQLGFNVASNGGVENPAEFDTLSVQQ